jgi:hypothetical protein
MIIAVDFDGTCVRHEFPKVGADIGAVPVLKALVANGHQLILWTVRGNVNNPTTTLPDLVIEPGSYLDDAVQWFKDNDIELYGINENPEQATWSKSPKCFANLYIDDMAIGAPLVFQLGERAYINWDYVYRALVVAGILTGLEGELGDQDNE